ncbi:class I tRNA ligase family protein, partial [Lentilactobacillus kefiri]
NQGMILGTNHEKMSKSKGNVINPDDIVSEYGADTLRVYEMFMGPIDAAKPWSTEGIHGAYHWLDRVWRLMIDDNNHLRDRVTTIDDGKLDKIYNQTVKIVSDDFEHMRFNVGISQMMIFVNEAYKADSLPIKYMEGFVKLLSPVAPHIAEELWSLLGHDGTITYEQWPTYDASKLVENTVQMVIQVNGKVRSHIKVARDLAKDKVEEAAKKDENVEKYIEGKTIRKVIVIPNKIVNIVVG